MAEDKAPNKEEQKPKRSLPIKTILVIVLVLLMEVGTIVGVKMLNKGPAPAEASDPIEETVEQVDRDLAEIPLAEQMSVDNYTLGRARIMVNFDIVATVKKDKQEDLTLRVKENNTQIKDRIRSLIGDAQPDQIRDPHLQVIKREVKTTVEEIVGEGLIESVLMPTWNSVTIE